MAVGGLGISGGFGVAVERGARTAGRASWSFQGRFSGIRGIRSFYGQDALEEVLAHDVGEVFEVDEAGEDLGLLG